MKRKLLATVFFLIALCPKPGYSAPSDKDTLKVLFVGNSYTYVQNIPQVVSILSDSSDTKLVTRKSVVGGARLSEHWHGNRGLNTKELIETGNFDIVVLQDQSMSTIEQPDSVLKYIALFCGLARKHGAKPYLYMTWAREKVPQYLHVIEDVYTRAAKENNAVLVPVGKAWEKAKQIRPDIQLYVSDGSHQSALGAYLSACVFVAAILGEMPRQIPNYITIYDIEGESLVIMDIDRLDAEFCRKIASASVNQK
ncbi:MAG: hypothetical protein JXB34_06145 [Bacteroidales bacterium]|nr:hypothetical protein [Bacteroidales bacterium]